MEERKFKEQAPSNHPKYTQNSNSVNGIPNHNNGILSLIFFQEPLEAHLICLCRINII